ncbi:hypothetical protein K493DRAFT_408253 [Basidiobolus meristosporus CBS 931.73]|uniref:Uncharacterized protein n=1 Tax=Basidiobolus meristosporus CBS 931.73 TaxID=1314790 RepID=A0A1Y1Y744_9FUNG|nr:hypothetical protein K493DRAFT_408253 [Basidiobolus meristosporus CBS 931.73]|eukprot:ORX93827.1 hypothetical protein K493DRAFT_408253 [Basidiobolus meristosporus CBS 931.73]
MKQLAISALTISALCLLSATTTHGAPNDGGYQTRSTDDNAATIFCPIFRLNCDTACKSRRGTNGNECTSVGSNNFRHRCTCRNGNDATSEAANNTPTRSTNNASYHNTNLGRNSNGDDYCSRHKGHCQDVCRNAASPNRWNYEEKCNWKKDGSGTTL